MNKWENMILSKKALKGMLFKDIPTFLEASGISGQHVFQNIQVIKWGYSWKYNDSTTKSKRVVTVPKIVEGYT